MHPHRYVPAMADDADDVRARLRDSWSRVAARAYEAAHGNPVPTEARGMRWRLDPRVAIALAGALVLALGVTWLLAQEAGDGVPLATVSLGPGEGTAVEVIVHVTGAVVNPGVVTLDSGARVADAVVAAGGLAPDADDSAVNLARVVGDGEQVYVPHRGEEGDGRINLNRADARALEGLPGIGPVLAERIVTDRAINGPYSSIADLARVPGIGDAILGEIAAMATV